MMKGTAFIISSRKGILRICSQIFPFKEKERKGKKYLYVYMCVCVYIIEREREVFLNLKFISGMNT